MVLMLCTDQHRYTRDERCLLLTVARDSIDHGLRYQRPPMLSMVTFPSRLAVPGASFVTLRLVGRLRGCIGSLHKTRPLLDDVSHNAYAAAFHDPRFPALTPAELPDLTVGLSILAPGEPLAFNNEGQLLMQLRPFVDGLTISRGTRRATFLPSVWHDIREPAEFLRLLKLKAGIDAEEAIECAERYQVANISSEGLSRA